MTLCCPRRGISEGKYSKRHIDVANRAVTAAASSARRVSGRKRRRYAGKAWTESGLAKSLARRGWKSHRIPALRGSCEVAFCEIDFKEAGARRHVDHIVPARLIRRLRAGNPDRRENLQCICGTCHGYKLQADHKLCLGDRLSYLEVLRTHH